MIEFVKFLMGIIFHFVTSRKSPLDKAYETIIKDNYGDELSEEDEDEQLIRVAIFGDSAYWVYRNTLYEADVVDGEVMKEHSRPFDAMDIPITGVAFMMELLDSLNEKEETE
jgi:hypothetical protein